MTSTTPMSSTDQGLRNNPVFWLMWALPGAAVIAGLATLAIALNGADRQLPDAYHWEGERLEADFARQRAAARLGVEVSLATTGGRCVAHVRHDDPASLDVLLTHSDDVNLDRALKLPRTGAGEYAAPCAPPPAGRWRISVDAPTGTWTVRGTAEGDLANVELRARDPGATRTSVARP